MDYGALGLTGLPRVKRECMMELYATFVNDWSSHWGDYRWQPLNGEHTAVADCRAVLRLLRRMANTPTPLEKERRDTYE